MSKKEYYLTFWGEIEKDNLIEKELNIREKDFWFKSQYKREKFKNILSEIAKKHRVIIVFREEEGKLSHKRTIAKVKLGYKGREYKIERDFGYEYPVEFAEFMFQEGNYSCDCNLSSFIQDQCDPDFSELECGEEIKIIKLTTRGRKGEERQRWMNLS